VLLPVDREDAPHVLVENLLRIFQALEMLSEAGGWVDGRKEDF